MAPSIEEQLNHAFKKHIQERVNGLNRICEDESVTTTSQAKQQVIAFIKSDGGSITDPELSEFAAIIVGGGHFLIEDNAIVGCAAPRRYFN